MSTEGIIEIATWTASEGYKADPSLIHPALEIVKPTKGVLGIWHGLQEEDKATVYLVVAWESVDAHHAFQANTELYSKLLAAFGPVRAPDSLPSLYHVDFKPIAIPRDHFARPVTEIVVHTLKEGKTAEEIEGLMLQDKVTLGGKQTVFGRKVEAQNEWVLAKGWNTVEEHQEFAKDPRVVEFAAILLSLVDLVVAHVKLTEFSVTA